MQHIVQCTGPYPQNQNSAHYSGIQQTEHIQPYQPYPVLVLTEKFSGFAQNLALIKRLSRKNGKCVNQKEEKD
jgi:hypothetical protein